MRVFDLIALLDPAVVPNQTKVHLATWNGRDHPLDVYLAGDFNGWQSWQGKRNFQRAFVLSLIALRSRGKWLFAGVHESHGVEWREANGSYLYKLVERPGCSELNGRLIAQIARSGRQPYRNGESMVDRITLDSILPERLQIGEFPGYRTVELTKVQLDLVVGHGYESWRAALSSVAGVYLISDTLSGELYVGSATGEGGIWQRWSSYALTGHGGNLELKQLLGAEGPQRAAAFRFSILEIADIHASQEEILRRESHWKRVLLTRDHGLNAN